MPKELDRQFSILSLCAGQGHDVIGVLRDYPHASRVRTRFIETDPRNVDILRARVAAEGLSGCEVILGDAADTSLYDCFVPVDLLVICGIFGNISNDDVFRTIAATPQLCATGAIAIFTRGRRKPPDLTPAMRAAFAAAGFVEASNLAPEDVIWTVGAQRFEGVTQPLTTGHLFTFVN